MQLRTQSGRSARKSRLLPPRAVIDIGSNTVRLVVYDGAPRAPEVIWNEKIVARLGSELSNTGKLPEESMELALKGLARFALLIGDLGIEDVQTVATAAARDASNGPKFLDEVEALGLSPRLLAGEEEAQYSAYGAIGAFPDAHGVVADLGGGSLELVSVENGTCHGGTSLPLGTLRLPALRGKDSRKFKRAIHKQLATAGWAATHPGPLYMIGGTWRALATYTMRERKYPLSDPHGFELDTDEAAKIAKKLSRSRAEKLAELSGINPMRAAALPNAAAMLRVMLAELEPDKLVFSSWGLREGLLFQQLEPLEQARDPLLTAVAEFTDPRHSGITDATLLVAWSVAVAGGNGHSHERLRLAAAMLARGLQRVEPNWRTSNALAWPLEKRWVGLDPRGRAMIAAALLGSCGKTSWPRSLEVLASKKDLRQAMAWGLGIRLANRLGAASPVSMTTSSLTRKKNSLVLRLDESRAPLAAEVVEEDLAALAEWLDLAPKLKIGR